MSEGSRIGFDFVHIIELNDEEDFFSYNPFIYSKFPFKCIQIVLFIPYFRLFRSIIISPLKVDSLLDIAFDYLWFYEMKNFKLLFWIILSISNIYILFKVNH